MLDQINIKNTEELLGAINLLAGAAQSGAKGILTQAAFNVMKASEAVAKAKGLELDQAIQDTARNVLHEAQTTLLNASQIPGAIDEARKDIIATAQTPYKFATTL